MLTSKQKELEGELMEALRSYKAMGGFIVDGLVLVEGVYTKRNCVQCTKPT